MDEDIRFLLNLQMIADEIIVKIPEVKLYIGEDRQLLEGLCFYRPCVEMVSHLAYIVREEDLAMTSVPKNHCSLIVLGKVPEAWDNGFHTIIQIPGEMDLLEVMNLCLGAFHKHMSWAEKLQNAVMREESVDELCRISYEYFQNPLFVHDPQLRIISCPVWKDGMIPWEKDEMTGLWITPLEELNELKTDSEYLGTLTTKNAQIFSAELRGYRDIYVNIWDAFGGYEGRLVICEIENSLKPGQFAAAEYLVELIRLTLSKRGHLDNTYKRTLYKMLTEMIQGGEFSNAEIEKRIAQCKWRLNDQYICIRMDAEEQEGSLGSGASVCNYVEARVDGSKAFYHDNKICIIINLSVNDHYTSDIASILRDGLFKAGFSNVFHDFTRLKHYYRQASTALEYCRRRNDTMWYYSFDDIAMDYIADLCCTEFEAEDLCAYKLKKLQEYDAENKTELFKTLCTYILKERNTVATSAQLYVGRSTLYYRLRKIKEITGLDAESVAEPVQNLYLKLSIFIMERQRNRKGE
ncbi:MAG: PucR family transcriptional regulator [Ruminococcus sp.]|jgi:hypothetical protein